MSILSKLLFFKVKDCTIYGIFPYYSRYAIYAEKNRRYLPYQKYIGMVYSFKKFGKKSEEIEQLIRQASRELDCNIIAAIPSSTAGVTNTLQGIFGTTIRRDTSSRQRKYNHNADLDEAGKINLTKNVAGETILLVDDIATTGKSLLYFRDYLLSHGARRVELLAVGVSLSRLSALPEAEAIDRMLAEAIADAGKDICEIFLTTTEFANLVGVDVAAITQMVKRGTLTCRTTEKSFPLVDAVREYCTALRGHYAQSRRDDSDQKAELDYWRARKLRQEVLEGRQELADQIASTILDRLRQACERLRQACAMHQDTADAVRALADELEAQGAVAVDAAENTEPEEAEETNDRD